MTIWTNTLVKNEDRYVWYAVMSVINHVDKMLIWDTGSTDCTLPILHELQKLYPRKIELNELGDVSIESFTEVRQQMLESTKSDWVIILDGDEVWWKDSITKLINLINIEGNELETIITRYVNVVGDIYHFQDEKVGRYEIDEHKGHVTIRAINMTIPGLKVDKPHGQQGFFDENGMLIQYREYEKRGYIAEPGYMHFTHLMRSTNHSANSAVPKRAMKLKHEIGNEFDLDYFYPEVFFENRPDLVTSVWEKMSSDFYVRSIFETPLRKIKRKLFKGKSGY
jgi:glycosyltransferase involved in cell wall biosynthesis